MQLSPDLRDELLALTASLRAHLEAEDELGAPGLAVSDPAPRLVVPRPPQPIRATLIVSPPAAWAERAIDKPPERADAASRPPLRKVRREVGSFMAVSLRVFVTT